MRKVFFVIIGILLFHSCSEEDYTPTLDEQIDVTIMFSPNGLGDLGYNDNILTGVFLAAKEKGFTPKVICPENDEEAEKIFSAWVREEMYKRSLFILGTNEYQDLAQTYFKTNDDANKTVLLFETESEETAAYTFKLSLYGVSYLAGSIAATLPHNECAILCANPEDPVLETGAKGFEDGFQANGGTTSHRFYITNGAEGYDMPNAAYQIASELSEDYGFIYPLAGGSNTGVYHYTRETKGTYTAGMDKDCSAQSPNVIYSVVKNIDGVLMLYIKQWVDGERWEKHRNFGFESQYVNLTLSPDYEDVFKETYQSWKSKAIEAENEYEKNN